MDRRFLPGLVVCLAACGGDDDGACVVPDVAQASCPQGGSCPAVALSGDSPSPNLGTFKGFADPSVYADPAVPGRVWLAYSWPHVVPGQDPGGNTVQLAAVRNHLARSDDGGASFAYQQILWPDVALADPEGSGEDGRISSETASLAAITSAGVTTWYGAHLRYFLRPITGYNPKYGTSWHVRIGAAASPPGLATATETVLGVTGTHGAYQPNVRMDQLAGLPLQHCAMLNNPTLYAQDQTLYLIVECLAFVGTTADYANTTTQVFATNPAGAAPTWTWRHVGKLGDVQLAAELNNDTILQPDVSRAADGALVWLVTPAHVDANSPVGTVGDGCVALELESIDPPALARDCRGDPVVRARITGLGVGACTHDRLSATGIIATSQGATGGNWAIRASGVGP
ncbi:MAG: hypothetical protein ACT4PK_00445 [Gammaproteobacteria bacterium]